MEGHIKKYVSQGLRVFACFPDKKPKTRTGFYAATTDPQEIKEQFGDFSNSMIGMPTGVMNGIVVVDIDIKDGRSVSEILEDLAEYGEFPKTFETETMSGGRHLWYLAPETKLSSSVRFFHKTLSVDIRANGGYVCVPDGGNYFVYDDPEEESLNDIKSHCAPLPQWIEEYKKPYDKISAEPELILPESEVREIRSALNYINSDDRDMWIRVGMALKATGSPAARGLWDEWSQKSDKYNGLDQSKRWATLKPKDITIASIFHTAKLSGWMTTYEKKEISAIFPPDEEKTKEVQELFKRKPFPDDLLSPPGLVGDIMNYILETAIKPQPIFALAGALCAVGVLGGRKVQTETGNRTNLYCLCVGASGSGKEAPRKAIKRLFEAAGCEEYASVEDLASDSAITTTLSKNPAQIFLLDEIGRFLKTTRNATKSSHLYNVVSALLKLYSHADQVYSGKSYADDDKKIKINQPHLCLYGTTVPETLYKGLTLDSATDGFLSRMLIFETDTPRPRKARRRNMLGKPPIEIIDQIKALHRKPLNVSPDGNLDHVNPNPVTIEMTESAQSMLEGFDDYIEDLRDTLEKRNQVEAIYNRTSQLAEQIALVLAIGNNIDNPIIDDQEMQYGINLANYLADHMAYVVNNYVADNEHEHEVKKLLNIIRTAGRIRRSEIAKKTQHLQGYLRNDLIETLKQSGQIDQYEIVDGERRSTWYVAK